MRRVLTPRLGLLTFAHFSTDAYSSFFPPLLPLLVTRLDLSLTRVGTVVALASLSSSFMQPVFGLLSDRLRRPWFVGLGPPVAALFMSAVGMAPSYAVLVALLLLGGLGVSSFHPLAAVLATDQTSRRGIAMSFFITGGTLGYSLGPLFAVSVVGLVGLGHTWGAALPGIVIGALLFSWIARIPPRTRATHERASLRELKPHARPLALLYVAVVCRSAVSYGFMTFLPLHLHARGYSVALGGALTTVYLAAGALGGFLGGWLADRWGGRRVVVASFIGSAPLFFAFLFLPDAPGLACLVLGSFIVQGSLPVNVVMGQELSPRHSSTITSLLMGAAWGVGALLIGPVGALADAYGLNVALRALACMTAVGLASALALPDIRRHVPLAEIGQPTEQVAG